MEQVISGIEGVAKLTAQNKALRHQLTELRQALEEIATLAGAGAALARFEKIEQQARAALARVEAPDSDD